MSEFLDIPSAFAPEEVLVLRELYEHFKLKLKVAGVIFNLSLDSVVSKEHDTWKYTLKSNSAKSPAQIRGRG